MSALKFNSILSIVVLSVSAQAMASDVTIPNAFVSGTAAKAEDVNANFNALATSVNDNNTRINGNTAAITGKANTTDVTDALAGKANTADVDSALAGKANSADLNAKANAGDVSANSAAISGLQQRQISSLDCKGNDASDIMVRVGNVCVDKYEASVWDATGSSQITGTLPCSVNGSNCSATDNTGADNTNAIYARSVSGVTPTARITWYQAAQACANAGKRLLTNAEWQVAAAGTPKTGCNNTNVGLGATGASSACISNWGVNDMAGNLTEWVAEWIQGNGAAASANQGAAFDNEINYGVNEPSKAAGSGTLAAVYRGGGFGGGGIYRFHASLSPKDSADSIGFRCAR